MAAKFTHTLVEPIVLTLKGPSGERQEKITSIEMPAGHRLRAKDLRCTDGHDGDVAKTIALIAHFSGLSIREIDELVEEDLAALSEHVASFRTGQGTGPKTGETS